MDGDSSDILGSPNTIVRGDQAGRWSGFSFGIKSTFTLALLLVIYAVGIRAWDTLLLWREKSYKLSMRRRHGIPDNDHRPFNVAYAAVMRARQDAEAAKRKARLEQVVLLGQEQRNTPPEQDIRQRLGSQRGAQSAWSNGAANGLPGRFNPSSDGLFASISGSSQTQTRPHSTSVRPLDFAERYNPNPTVRVPQAEVNISPPRAGPSRRSSRKNIFVSDDEGRKRGFDGDESEDGDHSKKSRIEGDEFIDGDEDAEWQESPEVPHRGSKRVLRDEDNEDSSHSKRPRDKRARKVSLEKTPQTVIEEMDIDDNEDEDQVPELRATSSRGKKRDRAAAGSTFGGDDEDSAHEAELEDEAKARRQRRKRRTVAKRKSDAGSSSRGQKRDRDIEEGESDVESDGGVTLKVSRKKRGKKVVQPSVQEDEEMRSGSDVSMNESLASSSKGRGRHIGDEWESNGVKYKIGPNGQRLRQALVKKARQKFNMPKDSQHPDRQVNLEVCVETWLTEEEYREAKSQLILAWQDSPKPSAEPETPTATQDIPSPQAPAGKNLLWASTSAATASPNSYFPAQTPPGTPQSKPKDRDQYRQSIATNVGLRINPFHQQAPIGKRIASAPRVASAFTGKGILSSSPGSPGLADSTNGISRIGPRAFSKWEKQELEAKAMMKLREANRKKEAEKERKLKEEKEKAEKEQKEREAVAARQTIPTITLTKPVEAKPAQSEVKPPSLSFAPPLGTGGIPKDVASKPLFGPPAGAPATPFTLPPMGAPAPPKPEDKSSDKAPLPTPSQPPPANSAFAFNNPSSSAPKSAANPFGANLAKDEKVSEQPKAQTPFGFGPPTASTAVPVKPPAAPFSWNAAGTPPIQPTGGAEKSAVPQASGGNSLLSRLAPLGNTASPAPQPQQNGSMFSFKPTPSEPGKPNSVFGNPAQSTTSSQSGPTSAPADATSAAGSSGLKFNFGIKPATAGPSSAPAPSTSSLSGALGGDSAKPASNPFGFKAPAESNGATTNGATAPKFSFGGPASTSNSPFGATTALGGNKPAPPTAPQMNDAPAKSAFSGFGGGSQSSTSAFGAASQGTPSPLFGSGTNTTGNVFGGGGTTNVFGSSAKPSEASKPASAFGSATPASGDTPKSAFSFGNPTPAAAPSPAAAPTASPFSFKFGDAAKTTGTSQASTEQSVFGKSASGPGGFGFGAGVGGFGFGNPPASAGQQQQ